MAYIEREKVLEIAKDEYYSDFHRSMADLTSLRELLEDTPAADVMEVKHGKWIIKNDEKDWRDKDCYRLVIRCSICGGSHFLGTTKYCNEYDEEKLKELGNIGDYSYCGRCGAKMDGKDGEQ